MSATSARRRYINRGEPYDPDRHVDGIALTGLVPGRACAAKASAINAHQAVSMIYGTYDFMIAAAFGVKTTEDIIEIGRMSGFAAHAALHFTARGADNEIGNFETRFVRAFGHEGTFDRK
jgi:hypothetical protein